MKSFIAAIAASCAFADEVSDKFWAFENKVANGFSSIQVIEDGVTLTKYVSSGGSTSNDWSIEENHRGYIFDTDYFDSSNPQYYRPNLLGGVVEYDIYLGNQECGCVSAFYTVLAPAKDWNGNVWADTDGLAYCDANKVDGAWCPEFDIMEANKWVWSTTPHKCDAPNA